VSEPEIGAPVPPVGPPPGSGGFSLDTDEKTFASSARAYLNRIRSGDPGILPSALGIVVLVFVFRQVSPRFLTRTNIGNLPGQGAYIAIIALGLVFVLLLGEIDLSAGTAGGVAAGIAAQAMFSSGLHHGIPSLMYWILIGAMVGSAVLGLSLRVYVGPAVTLIGVAIMLTGLDDKIVLAIVVAVAVGTSIGTVTGWLVAKVGIPSFIVTLALFLGWQGVLLFTLGSQPINVSRYPIWNGLANDNMSPLWSWVFVLATTGGYLAFTLIRSLRAKAKELSSEALSLVLIRGGALIALGAAITIFANQNRNQNDGPKINGIPWAASIPITLMIICTIALTKTTWGRHLFAIGGSAEAARRAGINITKVKVSAFVLCSGFGALGGVFLSSNTGSVPLDQGSGNVLLFSVAAAVIGGTSLFGGRGKPRDAIIGAIVIVLIPNGITLRTSLPAQYQQIITCGVLLLAATVDALARRRATTR